MREKHTPLSPKIDWFGNMGSSVLMRRPHRGNVSYFPWLCCIDVMLFGKNVYPSCIPSFLILTKEISERYDSHFPEGSLELSDGESTLGL